MTLIVNFFQMVGAAIRAGDAARNHHAPSARDLEILGLPANAFSRG
jgi:hypothetical protein